MPLSLYLWVSSLQLPDSGYSVLHRLSPQEAIKYKMQPHNNSNIFLGRPCTEFRRLGHINNQTRISLNTCKILVIGNYQTHFETQC